MPRFLPVVFCVLLGALFAAPARTEDPPKKLTEEERKELRAKREKLNTAGLAAFQAGKRLEATKAFEEALEVARTLYPKAEFPDGHTDLALSLNDLGSLY